MHVMGLDTQNAKEWDTHRDGCAYGVMERVGQPPHK